MKLHPALFAKILLVSGLFYSANAATLHWDGGTTDIDPGATPPSGTSNGGAGTWSTTLKNWDLGASEIDYTAWNNELGDTANFGGTVGTVTLSSDVSASKVLISGAYTITTDTNTLTLTGSGTTLSGNNAINISGTGAVTLGSAQTWENTASTMTVSAPVATGANLLTLSTRDNKLDVTGKISGNGGLTINSTYTTAIAPANSGSATLNNSNDYAGTTTLNGHIWLNSGGLDALGTDTSDIILNSGGFRLTGTGTGTVTRGLSITGSCGVSKISGDTTFSGKISGPGSFTASANFGVTARVILTAANDHTGATLSGPDGNLRLAHVDALQSSTMRWADNNGRSVFDLAANNLAYNIGGLGNSTVSNVSNHLNLGTGLGTGGNGLVSFGVNHQSNTYVGILSGSAGFRKAGNGIQTLIGANTYTGNTVVAQGTLKLGKINGQAAVNCTTGTTGTNVKRLTVPSSTNLYIGQAVSGPLIPPGARITNINTTTQVTLDLGPTSAAIPTTIDFAEILGSVTTSPVIEVLSGATFDVSAYPWTLQSTQSLGGAGTVTGPVIIAGKVSPGVGATTLDTTTETLTTGAISFTATSSYVCTLDGAKSDRLVAGTLTVDAAATITFSGTPSGASYVIATYTDAAPSPFATDASLPAGYSLDYATPGQIKLVSGLVTPPYDQWATNRGLTAENKAKGLNPDNDSAINFAEFALGGNPLSASDSGPALTRVLEVSGNPALTHTIAVRSGTTFAPGSIGSQEAAKDGIKYRVEGTQDLITWNATVTEVIPAIIAGLPSAPDGYEYHTFKTAGPLLTTPKDFMRVKITE